MGRTLFQEQDDPTFCLLQGLILRYGLHVVGVSMLFSHFRAQREMLLIACGEGMLQSIAQRMAENRATEEVPKDKGEKNSDRGLWSHQLCLAMKANHWAP